MRRDIHHWLWKATAAAVLAPWAQPSYADIPAVPVPTENPITEPKRVLGKILFWEEQLSSDDTVACGSCHQPATGGGDPRTGRHPGADGTFNSADDVFGSPGVARQDSSGNPIVDATFGTAVQVTGRAAPSYFNGLQAERAFWDGRAGPVLEDPLTPGLVLIADGAALENQALGPILSDVEMAAVGRSWFDVISKLEAVTPLGLATDIPADMAAAIASDPDYPALFDAAFGDPAITPGRIAMAIATYERTLVADQTPWDLGTMTAQQQQGWDVFRTSLCANCHVPPLFTDDDFHGIGLRPASEDLGRGAISGDSADDATFKTASLRNVGLRENLMHVGWITSAGDAFDFYHEANGHQQFAAAQSAVPTDTPGVFTTYDQVRVGGGNRAAVVAFLTGALTDPRVRDETFPFDRPTLASERVDAPADPGDTGGDAPSGTTPSTDSSGGGAVGGGLLALLLIGLGSRSTRAIPQERSM